MAVPSPRTLVAALMLATGVVGAGARAQSVAGRENGSGSPGNAAKKQAAASAGDVPSVSRTPGAAGPDIFLLPDEAGKLRRVLGYRYEDFFNAWRDGGNGPAAVREPKFVMTGLKGEAAVEGEAATVKFSIDVELQSDDWIEAPLELGTLIVSGAKIEGKHDRDFVMFDPARQRFAAWLKGNAGDKRTIVLEGQHVIDRDGDAARLELKLPAAATSRLVVTSRDKAEVELPASVLVTSEAEDDNGFRTRIDGAKGRLVVRWGQPRDETPARSSAFQAVADTVVNVEPGRLSYEAFISLRGFGEPMERVRVRLPRGTTASSPPENAGYELVRVSENGPGHSSPVVELRFLEPSEQPPVIHLEAEHNRAQPPRGAILRAEPFEVLGAFRQRGAVAVQVSDQLHAHFEMDGRLEQVDPAELPESLVALTPLAAFNSAGAAWALDIYTQPRQRKVRVTPSYDLHLGSQGAVLDVSLDYQITGGRTFDLRIDLRGWELSEQPIESSGAVDLVEQHITPEQILILPLKDSSAQQVRLRFTLRREAGLGVHDLPLPEVKDAFVLPGPLTVTCDDAWRVAAQIESSLGVAPAARPLGESRSAELAASLDANGDGASQANRDAATLTLQTFLPQARVSIDVSQRQREIRVKSDALATLQAEAFAVRQRLEFEVLYQPAAVLSASVPTELLANEALELLLDGKPLPAEAVDFIPLSTDSAADGDANLRLTVRLPEPAVGRHVIEFRSVVKVDDIQRAGQARVELPLAAPEQTAASTATVSVGSVPYNVSLWSTNDANLWSIGRTSASILDDAGRPPSIEYRTNKPATALALRLEPPGAPAPSDVRVEAVWAQTWLAGGERQDRCVYRFHATGSQVTLSLPTEMRDQVVEVLLDGEAASRQTLATGLLAVKLPAEAPNGWHTLEVRRRAPQRLGSWVEVKAAFPRLEENGAGAPFRWQLILPAELAAMNTPQGMTAEYQLGWQGLRWGRQPTQSQDDLARWTDASTAPAPPASTNQYVYSAFDAPSSVEVAVTRRLWIVVAAGLVALAIGLTWLYTRIGRSAVFWLVVCIAAAVMLVAYPAAAVIMVQAIGVGAALTLLSAVTRWFLAPTPLPPSPQPAAASSVASLGATQPWIADGAAASGITASSASNPHPTGTAP